MIYTCYGGGFGTMPSTAGKFFGMTNAGGIYGLMLVGWSIGGVAGPLIASWLIGSSSYTTAFTVIGVLALEGAVIPFLTKPPRRPEVAAGQVCTQTKLHGQGRVNHPLASNGASDVAPDSREGRCVSVRETTRPSAFSPTTYQSGAASAPDLVL